MAKNIRRMLAMVLVMCMIVSALPVQALAAEGDGTTVDGPHTESVGGLSVTTTTTTTQSTDETSGNTTVVVEIKQETSGTKDGVTITGTDTTTTTTVKDSSGNVLSTGEVNSGNEKHEWTEDVSNADVNKGEFSLDTDDVTITTQNDGKGNITFEGSATGESKEVEREGYKDFDVTATDEIHVSGSIQISDKDFTVGIAYEKNPDGTIKYQQKVDAEGNPVVDENGEPVMVPKIAQDALYCPVENEDYEGKQYQTRKDGTTGYCTCNHCVHDYEGVVMANPDQWEEYVTEDKNGNRVPVIEEAVDENGNPVVDKKPTKEGFDEGFDMVWTGSGEATNAAVAVYVKYLYEYETNEDGSIKHEVKTNNKGEIVYKCDTKGIPELDENDNPIPVMVPVYKRDADGNKIPVYECEKNADGTDKIGEDGKPVYKRDENGQLVHAFQYVQGDNKDHSNGMVSQASQFVLKHENGEYFYAYCMDASTGASPEWNKWYRLSNIENAIYNEETNPDGYITAEDAEYIKKIATYGYWGTNPVVYEEDADGTIKTDESGAPIVDTEKVSRGSVDSLVQMVEKYYADGKDTTITVTYPDGTTKSENILDVIANLTESEALAVTQAAIWSYSNNDDVEYWNREKFIDDNLSVVGVLSAMKLHNGQDPKMSWLNEYVPQKDSKSDARMQALYNLLIGLAGMEEKELKALTSHIKMPEAKESTVVPSEGVVTGAALVIQDKVAGHENNSDSEVNNDVYNTDLNFTLAFVPTENDEMMVCLYTVDAEGNLTLMKEAVLDPTDTNTDDGFAYDPNSKSWTFSGLQLQEGTDHTFDLQIQGTQYLNEGVYIYQAHGGRAESQTLVGLAAGKQDFTSSTTMTIKFDVDEERNVVAERVWFHDPETETTTPTPDTPVPTNLIFEEEAPQVFRLANQAVEEIPEEPVPLAAPVVTGDNSGMWVAVIMLSLFAMAAINLFDKKRQHEAF